MQKIKNTLNMHNRPIERLDKPYVNGTRAVPLRPLTRAVRGDVPSVRLAKCCQALLRAVELTTKSYQRPNIRF